MRKRCKMYIEHLNKFLFPCVFIIQSMDVMDHDGYFVFAVYYALNVIGAQFMLNLVCGVLSG